MPGSCCFPVALGAAVGSSSACGDVEAGGADAGTQSARPRTPTTPSRITSSGIVIRPGPASSGRHGLPALSTVLP